MRTDQFTLSNNELYTARKAVHAEILLLHKVVQGQFDNVKFFDPGNFQKMKALSLAIGEFEEAVHTYRTLTYIHESLADAIKIDERESFDSTMNYIDTKADVRIRHYEGGLKVNDA
jgi:hypothetical protein